MRPKNVLIVKTECKRVLERIKQLERNEPEMFNGPEQHSYFIGSKQTGALKRTSMDLTRALASMRKP